MTVCGKMAMDLKMVDMTTVSSRPVNMMDELQCSVSGQMMRDCLITGTETPNWRGTYIITGTPLGVGAAEKPLKTLTDSD